MKIWELAVAISIGFLTNVQYSLPAPIIPLELKRRLVSQTVTGVVIGSYSLGYIVGSIYPTDGLYKKLGRRITAQASFLVLSFSLILYSVCYFIPDQYRFLFVLVSIVARVIQGFSTGLLLQSLISLLSLTFPRQRGKVLSARACGSTLGMSLGGVIGGSLLSFLNYFGVFFSFAVLIFLSSFLLNVYEVNEDYNDVLEQESFQLTCFEFIRVRRAFLNLFCNGLCNLILFVLQPTLAIKLTSDFNFSSFMVGVYFFFFFGGGVITMIIMMQIPESWDKRRLICTALILLPLFSFLIGPSSLFHLPNSPILVASGMFLAGCARGICMALCPTDAITGALRRFPLQEVKVSDLSSSIYTLSLGCSSMVFPIIGSAMVEAIGFRYAIDMMSGVLLINALIYLFSTIADWRDEQREIQGDFTTRLLP